MTSLSSVRAELVTFLAEQVLAPDVPCTYDAVLAELGVDSFSLMEVVLFVERRWGVILPMERLTPENVHTVDALARCIAEVVRAA
ncbi:MAG: acyl carrier protein [Alphaproteobacteria bacterium]|nr:acyl carrier protein [Alphaproteobacteria bacterium]